MLWALDRVRGRALGLLGSGSPNRSALKLGVVDGPLGGLKMGGLFKPLVEGGAHPPGAHGRDALLAV